MPTLRVCLVLCVLSVTACLRAAADDPVALRQSIKIGANTSLLGLSLFPPDDPWNKDISKAPVDPHSDAIVKSIGAGKPLHPDFGTTYQGIPWGIPYVVVGRDQATIPVKFQYADESDKGPYPIPLDAPIEGGPDSDGDRHVLVLDKDNWKLYELWNTHIDAGGKSATAGSGAVFDLSRNSVQRPAGWTSADAAGLSVLAGLARYDEIGEAKKLTHALRFTVRRSRRAYVYPATHFASKSNDANLPPMGMRVRLKASFDTTGFPPTAKVILDGLKTYGMILADNGGDWFVSGAPNAAWNDAEINALKRVKGSDFEVIKMDGLVTK